MTAAPSSLPLPAIASCEFGSTVSGAAEELDVSSVAGRLESLQPLWTVRRLTTATSAPDTDNHVVFVAMFSSFRGIGSSRDFRERLRSAMERHLRPVVQRRFDAVMI
jgi:hypothetical protein